MTRAWMVWGAVLAFCVAAWAGVLWVAAELGQSPLTVALAAVFVAFCCAWAWWDR